MTIFKRVSKHHYDDEDVDQLVDKDNSNKVFGNQSSSIMSIEQEVQSDPDFSSFIMPQLNLPIQRPGPNSAEKDIFQDSSIYNQDVMPEEASQRAHHIDEFINNFLEIK